MRRFLALSFPMLLLASILTASPRVRAEKLQAAVEIKVRVVIRAELKFPETGTVCTP